LSRLCRAYSSAACPRAQGLLDRAIADFDKGIELKPDLAEAYALPRLRLRPKGDTGRAIADYDKVIELKPDMPMPTTTWGRIRHPRIRRRIAEYDRAIQLKPTMVCLLPAGQADDRKVTLRGV